MEKITIHPLKTHPEYYWATFRGQKPFEVRKNDRYFKIGDAVRLDEYDPEKEAYTGHMQLHKIAYILDGGQFGISKEYVVLGLYNPADRFRRISSVWVSGNDTFHLEVPAVLQWNGSCL
ncbi:MAG: DUF3850 domain-containing protein [Bacteroidota bacterium]